MIDLPPQHLAEVRAILTRYVPEGEVLAFGSRVLGRAREHSDLDLVIRAPAPLGMQRLAQIREALVESTLPIRVDVLDWHAVSAPFRARILDRNEPVLPRAPSHAS